MKVTITPTAVPTSSAFTLADNSAVQPITSWNWPNGVGGTVEGGFLHELNGLVQKDTLIEAQFLSNIFRQNDEETWNFTVQRTFNTTDNALAFLATHPRIVPRVGTLQVTVGGLVTVYMQNAVINPIRAVYHKGVSLNIYYGVVGSYDPAAQVGGAFSTTPP